TEDPRRPGLAPRQASSRGNITHPCRARSATATETRPSTLRAVSMFRAAAHSLHHAAEVHNAVTCNSQDSTLRAASSPRDEQRSNAHPSRREKLHAVMPLSVAPRRSSALRRMLPSTPNAT
ncbi:Unknown protein, partial [Striga hermonthica]